MRLRDEQASTGADDAVPRNPLPAGACGHGVTDGASAAREAQGTSEFPIGGHFAPGNLLDEAIDRLPGHEENFTAEPRR